MKRTMGFTLLELTIATAITAVVSALCLMGIMATAQTTRIIERESDCAWEMRNVLTQMTRELELAATVENTKVTPQVQPIAVTSNAETGMLDTIVFQTPVTAATWSTPITYQYVNEDANGNAKLDDGEDTNGDGRLTRRVIRRQTVDGAAQETVVGAASDIAAIAVTLFSTAQQRPFRLDVRLEISKNLDMGHATAEAITRDHAEASIQLAN